MSTEELSHRGKPVSPSNPLPTNDVSQASDTTAVASETVTFVGKNAIGATGIVSLDKKPILNLIKDKVGSFWGQNKVWKTDGNMTGEGRVTATTETATSADLTIISGKDLEGLFESATTGRYIVRIFDGSGNSLYGWIGGVATSGTSYTLSIYDTLGLATQSWVGSTSDFDGTTLAAEIYSFESSFSWGTGTVLTREVGYNNTVTDIVTLSNMSNGDFAIDYGNARILYKRAATGVSDTVGYTTGAASTSSIITASSNIEELNGVTLVADNAAAPATDYPLPTGGQYNATLPTYTDGDRVMMQFDDNGKLITTAELDAEAPVPPYTHSSAREDFTSAHTSSTTLTLGGAGTVTNKQLVFITVTNSAGTAVTRFVNGQGGVSMTISSNVITITGAGTPFASGDVYDVGINRQEKGYDPSSSSSVTNELSPLNTKTVTESLVDTTDVTAATVYYPSSTGASLDNYKDLSFSGKFIDADGTITMTVEMMNDSDTTSGDWVSVYGYDDKNNTTTNSWTVTNGTLTFANSFNNANYENYRVKVIFSGSTNTAIIKQRKKAL